MSAEYNIWSAIQRSNALSGQVAQNTADIIILQQQEGGVPELTRQVNTNTSNITLLQEDVDGLTTSLDALSDEVAQNTADITSLTDSYNNLAPQVAGLTQSVIDNTASIGELQTDVSTNTSNISTLNGKVDTNSSNITTLQGQVSSNTSNITTLNTDVATNTSNISTNTSNISTNTSNISSNTSNLITLNTDVATNTSNISTLQLTTATNTSNISTLQLTTATNTSNIATNTSNIETNTSNIETNTTDIETLTAKFDSVNVVIGLDAGGGSEGTTGLVAIGHQAGQTSNGNNCIYIGSSAGQNGGSFSNVIAINSKNVALNPAVSSACYIAPVRLLPNDDASTSRLMTYNPTTSELTYSTIKPNLARVIAVSSTAIPITADMNGEVIILTGNTTTQPFDSTTLGLGDTGLYITVKNGNFTIPATDITISGVSGATTIHGATNNQNAQMVIIFWNGSTLTAY